MVDGVGGGDAVSTRMEEEGEEEKEREEEKEKVKEASPKKLSFSYLLSRTSTTPKTSTSKTRSWPATCFEFAAALLIWACVGGMVLGAGMVVVQVVVWMGGSGLEVGVVVGGAGVR